METLHKVGSPVGSGAQLLARVRAKQSRQKRLPAGATTVALIGLGLLGFAVSRRKSALTKNA